MNLQRIKRQYVYAKSGGLCWYCGAQLYSREEADTEVLSDIIGRLGLADVAEFGLRWQDCEEFLRRLGYRATVTVSTA